jgi:hypothetical protein
MRDTIDMAREAGFDVVVQINAVDGSIAHLKAFEALIRADEREACAKVCDDFAKYSDWPTADNCAAAIRARNAK